MNLGINQKLILKRAHDHGFTCIIDVKQIYNLPSSNIVSIHSKSRRRALIVLEKLELAGYLEKEDPDSFSKWLLTQKGKTLFEQKEEPGIEFNGS